MCHSSQRIRRRLFRLFPVTASTMPSFASFCVNPLQHPHPCSYHTPPVRQRDELPSMTSRFPPIGLLYLTLRLRVLALRSQSRLCWRHLKRAGRSLQCSSIVIYESILGSHLSLQQQYVDQPLPVACLEVHDHSLGKRL